MLDIRDVFDRVSEIAAKVLPHDAVAVTELSEARDRVRWYASKGLGDLPVPFETPVPDPQLLTGPWDFVLMDDIAGVPMYSESPGIKAGMHSALLMPVRLEGQLHGGLNFAAGGGDETCLVSCGSRVYQRSRLALSTTRVSDVQDALRRRSTPATLTDHGRCSIVFPIGTGPRHASFSGARWERESTRAAQGSLPDVGGSATRFWTETAERP